MNVSGLALAAPFAYTDTAPPNTGELHPSKETWSNVTGDVADDPSPNVRYTAPPLPAPETQFMKGLMKDEFPETVN